MFKKICFILLFILTATVNILAEDNYKVVNVKGEVNLNDSRFITIYWNNPDELNRQVNEKHISDVFVLFDVKLDDGKFLSERGMEMISVPYDSLSYTFNPFCSESNQNAENTTVKVKIYYKYKQDDKTYVSKSFDNITLGYNSYIVGGKPWSKKDLELASNMGIIQESMREDVSKPVTRYEFIKMLMKLDGYLSTHKTKIEFKFPDNDDVDINLALNLGIVHGAEGGNFFGDRNLTKEEMATIIYRYLNLLSKINHEKSDTKIIELNLEGISEWASDAFVHLIQLNIIKGNEKGELEPKKTVTREQATVMIMRILKV